MSTSNDLYLLIKVPYDRIDNPLKTIQDQGIFRKPEEAIIYGITLVMRSVSMAYAQVVRLDVVDCEIILEHVIDYDSEQKQITITNDGGREINILSIEEAIARAGVPVDKHLRDDIQEYMDVPNHSYQVGDWVYLPFYELRFWQGCGRHTRFKVVEVRPRRIRIAPEIGKEKVDWDRADLVYAPYARTKPDE